MSKNIIISTNKKNNNKNIFKIDFKKYTYNSPKMSLNSLNNDILIKIIETITEEKNKQIKKLEEELEKSNQEINEYQNVLEENDMEYFKCYCCKKIITDNCDNWNDSFELRDNNADGLDIICGSCMEKINNNVDRQNEIMEELTKYVVNVRNNNYPKCWNTFLKYKTYEEIPMCYKNSNICIEKHYYNDWEKFKNDEDDEVIIEIINGNKNNNRIHFNMINELEYIFDMNDIYLHSVLQEHRPKFSNGVGSVYDSDIHYRSIPIKTLLNVDWCKNKCSPRGMIGRSWWKRQGYNCYSCGCAYKSLTEQYKKKYLN